jgi:predicted nucleic acid-binding protein
MSDLLFADTNLLIYAMDPREPLKRERASKVLLACAESGRLVTSPQTLNECYRVLAQKRRLVPAEEARNYIATFAETCRAPLDWETIVRAWEVSDRRSYNWWDCLMLAAAARAGCTAFLTEDLTSGDEIDGMIVVNPFTTDLTLYLQQN